MNWTDLWNQIIHINPGWGEILLRLVCAMIVGLVIGTEREYTHRPAGMRTHILVALGACVAAVTGELLFHHYTPMGGSADPARLSAQVITGVGFLGAGTIMKEGLSVKGLTTAASVWAVACLGIASGFGYYALAILGMVLILVTLTIFEWVQKLLLRPGSRRTLNLTLDTSDISATLELVNRASHDRHAVISNLSAQNLQNGHRLSFRVAFSAGGFKSRREAFFEELVKDEATIALHTDDEPILTK